MSKTAIKTGRYTHELRSKNILEVKRLQNQTNNEKNDDTTLTDNQSHEAIDDVKCIEYESALKKVLLEETVQVLMTGQAQLYEHLDEYYDDKLMYRRQLAVYVSSFNKKARI